MTSFDLRTEPWITVRLLDGGVDDVSLRDVFARSPQIREVVGELPTTGFAVLRLLLAVLHRAIGPYGDPSARWDELWDADALPVDRISAYLDNPTWADRFDLLHPVTPFMQVADLRTEKGEVSGLEKLIADVPNGHPYFTTRAGDAVQHIEFAEAARWVVHCQAFDPSGIRSGVVGDERASGGRSYPIGTGWSGNLGGVFVEGHNLRETLLLNLVLAERDTEVPWRSDDVPVWERQPLTAGVEVRHDAPTGPVDLYTWPSRRLRIVHNGREAIGLVISNGDPIALPNQFAETMTAWRFSTPQTKKLGKTAHMPTTHQPDRSMWRGLAGLLSQVQPVSETAARPTILWWLDEVELPDDFVVRTRAVAMAYGANNSTVAEVVDDALILHTHLFRGAGREAAAAAQDAVEATDRAVWTYGDLAADLAEAAGDKNAPDRKAPARSEAYFVLDSPFRAWLARLGPDDDPQAELRRWFDIARTTLLRMGRSLAQQASPAAFGGRVVVRGGKEIDLDAATALSRFEWWLGKALPAAERPLAETA